MLGRVFSGSNLTPSPDLLLLCAAAFNGTDQSQDQSVGILFVTGPTGSSPVTHLPICALDPVTVAPRTDVRIHRLRMLTL